MGYLMEFSNHNPSPAKTELLAETVAGMTRVTCAKSEEKDKLRLFTNADYLTHSILN